MKDHGVLNVRSRFQFPIDASSAHAEHSSYHAVAFPLVVSEGHAFILIVRRTFPRAMVFIAEGNKKATRYNANGQ